MKNRISLFVVSLLLCTFLLVFSVYGAEQYNVSATNFFTTGQFDFSYEDDAGNVLTSGFTRTNPNVYTRYIDLDGGFREYIAQTYRTGDPSGMTQTVEIARGSIVTSFPLVSGSDDKTGTSITDLNISLFYAFTNGEYSELYLNPSYCKVYYSYGNNIYDLSEYVTFSVHSIYNNVDSVAQSFQAYVLTMNNNVLDDYTLRYGGNFQISFVWNTYIYNTYPTVMYFGIAEDSSFTFGFGDVESDTIVPSLPDSPELNDKNQVLESQAQDLLDSLGKVSMPSFDISSNGFDPYAFDFTALWDSSFGSFLIVLATVSLGIGLMGYILHGKR